MQQTRAQRLHARVQKIRLPLKVLADAAGVHEDTLHAFLHRGRDPRLSTIDKIEQALAAEEARLREVLAGGDAA